MANGPTVNQMKPHQGMTKAVMPAVETEGSMDVDPQHLDTQVCVKPDQTEFHDLNRKAKKAASNTLSTLKGEEELTFQSRAEEVMRKNIFGGKYP